MKVIQVALSHNLNPLKNVKVYTNRRLRKIWSKILVFRNILVVLRGKKILVVQKVNKILVVLRNPVIHK